jgi:type I restriction enzyme, S subunit
LTGINLKKINLPVPPLKLQNQFAQIVENIEAQKALVKQSLQKSEDLFNGLVQKAFKGELTGKE